MSNSPLNFLKCTGKGRMVAVCWVFSLPTGTVTGTKFQWIKMKLWLSGNKNWQMFATMPQPTNGWWWTVATTNRFNETWVKLFAWLTNFSLTWPLFIAPLMSMCKQWKVHFLNNYLRLRENWPVRKPMVGTHWQIRLPLGFISNKPSKKTATCSSKWWNLWPSLLVDTTTRINWPMPGRHSYKMRHTIVFVDVVWMMFTVKWKFVLPRSIKSETLSRPTFWTNGRVN